MRLKKKIEEPKIQFVTSAPGMIDLVPPVPMRRAMPEWMRKTPLRCPAPAHGGNPGVPGPPKLKSNMPEGITTIKACAGVIDIMKWGYMIPLWADHEIITFPDSHETNRYQARPAIGEVSTSGFMPEHQENMPLMEGEYKFSPKLDSPWQIITPPGWSVVVLPLPLADEEFNQPWRIVPGIIDTDRYHSFNLLLKWRYDGRYVMEQGTPMCMVVPFKRDTTEIPMELKQIERDEWYKLAARGKGGTGGGDRMIVMPYQKWRKKQGG